MNIINKVQIGSHVINQPFYHSGLTVSHNKKLFAFNTNNFTDNKWNLLEYVLIIINTNENLQKSEIFVKIDNKKLHDNNYRHNNKLYPLEYETAYDSETNLLLANMVRKNMHGVLFIPMDIELGHKLSISILNISWEADIDFYFKTGTKENIPQKNRITSKYILDDVEYRSTLIGQLPDSGAKYGNISTIRISKNGDFITNFCLNLFQDINKQHIKNYYKLYKKIFVNYAGHDISTIPLDYIILHLKIIKEINICDLNENGYHHIPINLNDLIGISNIPFHLRHHVVVELHPNAVSKFHHDTTRNIKCNNIDYVYDSYINKIPADIWNVILEYLDCNDLCRITETCKYMYSLVPQKKINSLYDIRKITIEDLSIHYIELDVMYATYGFNIDHLNEFSVSKNPDFNKLDEFTINTKSIIQHEIIIDGLEYLFNIDKLHPIDYIVIEFDVAGQYDILDMNETTNIINGVITDLDFYSKMHNPLKNRYVIYFDANADNINFVFKEFVYSKLHIYIIYNVSTSIK
jgi:hypothetical protein